MHHFFIPPECIAGDRVRFPPRLAHQITRVLRMRPGNHVIVLDDTGTEYEVELTVLGPEVTGSVYALRMNQTEPQVSVHLYQSVLKGDKFEWIVQKCTELGIAAVAPVLSARCIVGPPSDQKLERYRDVAREAAEQSGRGRLPHVHEPMRFSRAVVDVTKGQTETREIPAYLLWEEAARDSAGTASKPLVRVLPRMVKRVTLFVGPEGGYAPDEAVLAASAGLEVVTLGPRILRAETAAIAATTLVMGLLDELGT